MMSEATSNNTTNVLLDIWTAVPEANNDTLTDFTTHNEINPIYPSSLSSLSGVNSTNKTTISDYSADPSTSVPLLMYEEATTTSLFDGTTTLYLDQWQVTFLAIALLLATLLTGSTWQWVVDKGLFKKGVMDKANQYNVILAVAAASACLQAVGCFWQASLMEGNLVLAIVLGLDWIVMTHTSIMLVSRKLSLTYPSAEQTWQKLSSINLAVMPFSLWIAAVWIWYQYDGNNEIVAEKNTYLQPISMGVLGILEASLSGMFVHQMHVYDWLGVETTGKVAAVVITLADLGCVFLHIFVEDDLVACTFRGAMYCLRVRLEVMVVQKMVQYLQNKRKMQIYSKAQRPRRRRRKQNNNSDNTDDDVSVNSRASLGSCFSTRTSFLVNGANGMKQKIAIFNPNDMSGLFKQNFFNEFLDKTKQQSQRMQRRVSRRVTNASAHFASKLNLNSKDFSENGDSNNTGERRKGRRKQRKSSGKYHSEEMQSVYDEEVGHDPDYVPADDDDDEDDVDVLPFSSLVIIPNKEVLESNVSDPSANMSDLNMSDSFKKSDSDNQGDDKVEYKENREIVNSAPSKRESVMKHTKWPSMNDMDISMMSESSNAEDGGSDSSDSENSSGSDDDSSSDRESPDADDDDNVGGPFQRSKASRVNSKESNSSRGQSESPKRVSRMAQRVGSLTNAVSTGSLQNIFQNFSRTNTNTTLGSRGSIGPRARRGSILTRSSTNSSNGTKGTDRSIKKLPGLLRSGTNSTNGSMRKLATLWKPSAAEEGGAPQVRPSDESISSKNSTNKGDRSPILHTTLAMQSLFNLKPSRGATQQGVDLPQLVKIKPESSPPPPSEDDVEQGLNAISIPGTLLQNSFSVSDDNEEDTETTNLDESAVLRSVALPDSAHRPSYAYCDDSDLEDDSSLQRGLAELHAMDCL